MSVQKPTRTFLVATSPIVISTDDGFETVVPPMQHTVSGCDVKYVHGETGFFQILDRKGTVVFNCPFHQLLWCRVDGEVTVLHTAPEGADEEGEVSPLDETEPTP
jgi:hypothetical protein